MRVKSPDRSVRAVMTAADGVRVDIDPRRYPEHGDRSLAEQLSAAISGALTGFGDGCGKILAEEVGPGDPEVRGRIDQALREFATETTSSGGLVRLRMRESTWTELRSRPRCVPETPREEVEANVIDAVSAVCASYPVHTAKAVNAVFGSPSDRSGGSGK